MVPVQDCIQISSASSIPQLTVPSPIPFSPLSSSSNNLKFLGTTKTKLIRKLFFCLTNFFPDQKRGSGHILLIRKPQIPNSIAMIKIEGKRIGHTNDFGFLRAHPRRNRDKMIRQRNNQRERERERERELEFRREKIGRGEKFLVVFLVEGTPIITRIQDPLP